MRVYDDADTHIGYWVDDLGFVDTATHDSPTYDVYALRVERFGLEEVQRRTLSRRHYLRGWTRTIRTGPLDHSPERAGIGTFWRSCEDREVP